MGNNLDALTTVFTEFYYWITVPLMFLIHHSGGDIMMEYKFILHPFR